MGEELLRVENLSKTFEIGGGFMRKPLLLRALQDISFSLKRGETLGIVGESGCGKSMLGRCILQLLRPEEGRVLWLGRDLVKVHGEEMRRLKIGRASCRERVEISGGGGSGQEKR